ncbi:hypothetical protein CVS48_10290 [Achromobacter spanius]|uniref:hypothetical protein n=1 Tax=Achromobacter spanius TaxID=217203 RepID=UPI000C2C90C9|nr:hypothetical protein [Achromobacter spanius]AUA56392.1 hypothetical protein CVS48_10290 [Achromobacter spanius]
MKKIIAEVMLLQDKSAYPRIYCVGEDGVEDEAVTYTLCDAVWELCGAPISELKELIEQVACVEGIPGDPKLADMSINDKLIWVRLPFSNLGGVCVE